MTESAHHYPETVLPPGPVARGITITGLASVRWRSGADSPLAQIQHAHDDWFANTVRLQVGVPLLRGKSNATASWRGGGPVAALRSYLARPANGMTGTLNGNHYNTDFLAYLDQAVDLAQQLGLAVVICAQHENLDYTAMPEGNDIAFWKIIHDHYGPDVICDLFNEPTPAALYANAWAGWHSGGTGSDGVRYTGFQSLVNQLRTYGLSNTFWVEGCGHSGTLAGINGTAGNHQLTDPDNNLVYSMHHPEARILRPTGISSSATWSGWASRSWSASGPTTRRRTPSAGRTPAPTSRRFSTISPAWECAGWSYGRCGRGWWLLTTPPGSPPRSWLATSATGRSAGRAPGS
jgi:hypothetical protein